MTDPRSQRTFDEIVDFCIDEIAADRLSAEEALGRWPEHRDELQPLLAAAFTISELPQVAEHAPDPERRADFLSSIRTTPQQSPRRSWTLSLPSLGTIFGASLPRLATVAAPAAVIAIIAVVLTLGGGAAPASASTLTVFSGAVEQEQDGTWQPLGDGATLDEGTRLRTTADGHALLTFADGSTAALDPSTELVIEQASIGGERSIALQQLAGRIWNDVAPGAAPASYVVRTADAVIEAHGTTFETLVSREETSVVAAEGAVDVVAGDERTSVAAGQVLRIARQRLVAAARTHPAASAPVTLTVEGPFVASLRSANGAATGALPSGVTFQQIPGVSTTDPGDGPQQLLFYDIESGRYEFTLRRIGTNDVAGQLVIDTPEGSRIIELPASTQAMTVHVDISFGDGRISIRVVDRESDSESTLRERIVDSARTAAAEPVAEQRARIAAARLTPGATRATDRTATPEVDRTPEPTDLESRLRHVLAAQNPERRTLLRGYLEDFGRDDALWLTLRELLLADAELRDAFIDALAGFESEELKAAIRERLGLPTDSTDRSTSLATATPVPTTTASPTATDRALADATATAIR